MDKTDNSREDASWPLPQFRFEVDFGTGINGIRFQEVTGMDVESRVIEYRNANSPLFSTAKMPGIVKQGNVTMKKGVFVNDNTFWDWHNQIKMNPTATQSVLIKLLDGDDNVTMQWTLNNATPAKVTGTDLQSEGNEVAVESVDVAFETMVISAP